jgi:hypothetical protein
MEQQQKKSFYKKWWVWGLGVFFLLVIIMGSGSSKDSLPTNTQTTAEAEQTAQPASEKQYIEIFKFSGNGTKKSEPFTITGSRFKITYDCKGDFCGAFVYQVSSKLPQLVMNSSQPIKDETILYGSGEYYLDANVMGNFTMTVYDYK